MPVYQFKCSKCELKFEKVMSIKAEEAVACPQCSTTAQKLPPTGVSAVMGEVTSIPKEIDKLVGKDAEKRWMEYEERKSTKEKIRQESGTPRLSRDPDGNYSPVSVTKDGVAVSEEEAVKLRKEMFQEFETVKKDPGTEKIKLDEE